jgi:CO/xanthine dehydrogenase Mo-binding subunit
VRVVLSREDVVRLGPKRPPVAAGVRLDGTGIIRTAAADGIAAAIATAGTGLTVEEVAVAGPSVSSALRGAGWAEATILARVVQALRDGVEPGGPSAEVTVSTPEGGRARSSVTVDASGWPIEVMVEVACGDPLDGVVLRSYVMGATHMALGWVCSEAIAVGMDGNPEDLTIRSFGVLRAKDTPPVTVVIDAAAGPAVNGSNAAFAAVAAATWLAQGLPSRWPTRRGAQR